MLSTTLRSVYPTSRASSCGKRRSTARFLSAPAPGASSTRRHEAMARRHWPAASSWSRPQTDPRPVIAWTHGTTGVVEGCAPSVIADPFANVPAVQPLLDKGWIFVATDYAGQGTTGPHAYLIGKTRRAPNSTPFVRLANSRAYVPATRRWCGGTRKGAMLRCGPRSLRRPTRPMSRWRESPRSRPPATCGR